MVDWIYTFLPVLSDNSMKITVKVEEATKSHKTKQMGEETTKHGNERGQKVLEYEKWVKWQRD